MASIFYTSDAGSLRRSRISLVASETLVATFAVVGGA